MLAVNKLLAWVLLTSLIGFSCRIHKPTNNGGTTSTDTTSNTSGTNPGTTGIPRFGALIGPPNKGSMDANDFKKKVARQLTIQYLRDNINLDTPKAHTLLESNFNVVLNLNSTAPRMVKHYH